MEQLLNQLSGNDKHALLLKVENEEKEIKIEQLNEREREVARLIAMLSVVDAELINAESYVEKHKLDSEYCILHRKMSDEYREKYSSPQERMDMAQLEEMKQTKNYNLQRKWKKKVKIYKAIKETITCQIALYRGVFATK